MGALNLRPVTLKNGIVDKHERRASIGNRGAGLGVGLSRSIAHRETLRVKFPEPPGAVDRRERQLTLELGTIDFSELVGSHRSMSKVGGEQRLRETGLYVVEKGLLCLRLHGVDGAEAKAKKTIGVGIFDEAICDGCGKLDGLI